MKRSATVIWKGTGKEGNGTMSTQSGVLTNSPYSHPSRFGDAKGTNPEELIAAAHAGCFSMKLSFVLTKAGFPPEQIETRCEIDIDQPKGEIMTSDLHVRVKAPGIDKATFDASVNDAKTNCPVSKLLKAEIRCQATLI